MRIRHVRKLVKAVNVGKIVSIHTDCLNVYSRSAAWFDRNIRLPEFHLDNDFSAPVVDQALPIPELPQLPGANPAYLDPKDFMASHSVHNLLKLRYKADAYLPSISAADYVPVARMFIDVPAVIPPNELPNRAPEPEASTRQFRGEDLSLEDEEILREFAKSAEAVKANPNRMTPITVVAKAGLVCRQGEIYLHIDSVEPLPDFKYCGVYSELDLRFFESSSPHIFQGKFYIHAVQARFGSSTVHGDLAMFFGGPVAGRALNRAISARTRVRNPFRKTLYIQCKEECRLVHARHAALIFPPNTSLSISVQETIRGQVRD